MRGHALADDFSDLHDSDLHDAEHFDRDVDPEEGTILPRIRRILRP
jgi:hypothetical protein